MAKYRQSRKDRRDESRGMKRYEERVERDSYRRVSGESAMDGMISEDHRAPANLPQNVVMREYPSWRYLEGAYYDDTLRGLDDMNDENERKVHRSMFRPS